MWVGAAVWPGVPVLDPFDPEQFEDGHFSLLRLCLVGSLASKAVRCFL